MQFDQAVAFCSSHGSSLAKISTEAENTLASQLCNTRTPQVCWLGLTQTPGSALNENWFWQDGSIPSQYNAWADGEPNDNGEVDETVAFILSSTSKWYDGSSDASWYPLCMRELTTEETVGNFV